MLGQPWSGASKPSSPGFQPVSPMAVSESLRFVYFRFFSNVLFSASEHVRRKCYKPGVVVKECFDFSLWRWG